MLHDSSMSDKHWTFVEALLSMELIVGKAFLRMYFIRTVYRILKNMDLHWHIFMQTCLHVYDYDTFKMFLSPEFDHYWLRKAFGADVNKRSSKGRTALDFAKAETHFDGSGRVSSFFWVGRDLDILRQPFDYSNYSDCLDYLDYLDRDQRQMLLTRRSNWTQSQVEVFAFHSCPMLSRLCRWLLLCGRGNRKTTRRLLRISATAMS